MRLKIALTLFVFLLSLSQTSALSLKKEITKFIPESYRVVEAIQADLNGDGIKEIILGLEAKEINLGLPDNLPAKIIILTRKEEEVVKLWGFDNGHSYTIGNREKPEKPAIMIEDLNLDKTPEILFSLGEYAASDAFITNYVATFKQGKIIMLLDKPLVHSVNGGLIIVDTSPLYPGKELILYSYFWGKEETHADPHRYEVNFYGWSTSKNKFVCYKKTLTKQTSERGLLEILKIINQKSF